MKNSNQKIKSATITKTDLISLYFDKNMSLDEIGRHYGYLDRQPIMRLFKKFDIKTRSKADLMRLRFPIPEKQRVLDMMAGDMSILACSKKNNIPRATLTGWLNHYDITTEYFVNKDIKDVILSEKYTNSSPKEISDGLGVAIDVVKYYKKTFTAFSYNKNELLAKLYQYGYDLNSRGFVGQILSDDKNIYNSIIELTKDHKLQSNKFTERLYRIINDYTKDQSTHCKYCSTALKFYTLSMGYGNSSIGMCNVCLQKHNGFGVSAVSQKLFNDVYRRITLSSSDECYYHSLNEEHKLFVKNIDIVALSVYAEHINKSRYLLDFVLNNKVIEFDGTYYHKDTLKEEAKDAFLKHKGFEVLHVKEKDYKNNPEQVVNICLQFLKL